MGRSLFKVFIRVCRAPLDALLTVENNLRLDSVRIKLWNIRYLGGCEAVMIVRLMREPRSPFVSLFESIVR